MMGVARKLPLLMLCIAAAAVSSCGDTERVAAPLPVAYPRLPVTVSDTMTLVEGTLVPVQVNPSARVAADSASHALTVTYPAVNTDIYFTFIPYADDAAREKILDARRQRISLNLNGVTAATHHPADNVVVVVASSGTQTPVQLLADVAGCIVTATAFIHDPRAASAYDSIAPLVDVLSHDLERAIIQ